MSWFKKKTSDDDAEYISTLYSQIQLATDLVIVRREQIGLPDNASYRLAYTVLWIFIYSDVGKISLVQKNTLLAILTIHYAKELNIDVRNLADRYMNQFQVVKKEVPDDPLTMCISTIEAQIHGASILKKYDYMQKVLDTTIEAIHEVIDVVSKT